MPHFQYVTDSSAAQMLDSIAMDTFKIPSLILMENAVKNMADVILDLDLSGPYLIFSGPGNNGADGLALGRQLIAAGKTVMICLSKPSGNVQFEVQKAILEALKTEQIDPSALDQYHPDPKTVIIDALFGSGLSRDITGISASLIDWINRQDLFTISVDGSSGLSGTTGKVMGCAVRADLSLTLNTWRQGFLINDGPLCCGTVRLCSIGMPDLDAYAKNLMDQGKDIAYFINRDLAKACLPQRNNAGNKGSYGKLLCIGGSFAMQGALCMAASSAWKAGAGTITCLCPRPAAKALVSKLSFAMTLPAPADDDGFFAPEADDLLKKRIKSFNCLLFGNGMGSNPDLLPMLQTVLEAETPLVLDADGLNLLSKDLSLLKRRKTPIILTPHLLEFSRLSGLSLEEVESDPVGAAKAFVREYPCAILVLKSERTFIACTKGCAWLDHPDGRLSKGGSGDVLAGLIAGLLAQTVRTDQELMGAAFHCAICSAYVHNRAADDSSINPRSFDMEDLIAGFSRVFNTLSD